MVTEAFWSTVEMVGEKNSPRLGDFFLLCNYRPFKTNISSQKLPTLFVTVFSIVSLTKSPQYVQAPSGLLHMWWIIGLSLGKTISEHHGHRRHLVQTDHLLHGSQVMVLEYHLPHPTLGPFSDEIRASKCTSRMCLDLMQTIARVRS